MPDKVHTKRCALRHGCMAGFVLVFPSAGMGAKLIGAMTTFGMTMNRCVVDFLMLNVDVDDAFLEACRALSRCHLHWHVLLDKPTSRRFALGWIGPFYLTCMQP